MPGMHWKQNSFPVRKFHLERKKSDKRMIINRKRINRKKNVSGKYFGIIWLLALVLGGQAAAAPVVIKNSTSAEEDQDTEMEASPYAERLQKAKALVREKEVGRYGMVPVYPRDIADGTYEIQVESNSPFFKITQARIFVDGEEMTAEITISSLSYQYVYPGTALEAGQAEESGLIGYREEDGKSIFSFPLEALDQEIDCAAFSKKKQQWYDRKLVFDAASLPEEALWVELPDYELIEKAILAYQTDGSDALEEVLPEVEQEAPEPVEVALPDGEYSIEVNMSGGSGRASVSSPTLLTVREGKAWAKLLWSSAYYDYMIINGQYFYNLTTDGGNSTFEIPITVMDEGMMVIADTTAMGDPVEIEYTLNFYSETIGEKGQIPQEAAKKVLMIAAVLIVAGGILNHFVKKRRLGYTGRKK